MLLRHATTRAAYARIQHEGLRVACADPAAKLKGVWLHTASQSAWAVVHTIRKHGATLEDVILIEVNIPRTQLKRFRTGLWVTPHDIATTQFTGKHWDGATFGASASE